MTDNVKSILAARLDRLMKEGVNLNNLIAYTYKAMDEYGVNPKNEQAIRATRAMSDIWAKSEEIKFNGIEDLCEAYENYPEESIRNARCDKIMEGYDWDFEAYWAQKMEEHGVDTEDEQAIRAINAMADIWNKAMEMSENTMERLSNAVENHAKLKRKVFDPA